MNKKALPTLPLIPTMALGLLLVLATGCGTTSPPPSPEAPAVQGSGKALDALRDGKLKRAAALFSEDLEEARKEDDPAKVGEAATGVGLVRYLEDDLREADRHLAAADASNRLAGEPRERVWILRAKVARKANDPSQAQSWLAKVLASPTAKSDEKAEAHLIRYELARAAGDATTALAQAQRLGTYVVTPEAASLKPDFLLAKAELNADAGNPSAPADFETAMNAFRDEMRWRDLASTQGQLGTLLAKSASAANPSVASEATTHLARAGQAYLAFGLADDYAKARELLQIAVDTAPAANDPVLEAWVAGLVVETDPVDLRWKK